MTIGLRRNPQLWGWFPNYSSDRVVSNTNAAANWNAYSILLDTDRQLSKVRIYCTTTGAPIAADFRCELYSHSSTTGAPNASIETATVPGSVSNGLWTEWTGFTTTLVANTMYWLVFKNLNASPTVNFYGTNHHGNNSMYAQMGCDITSNWGWAKRSTTNSGTSWAVAVLTAMASFRAEFSDGYFEGFPLGARTNAQVYGTREAGAYFISPDVPLNVKGIAMPLTRTGSPAGQPRYRLYVNGVLQATTGTITASALVITTGFGYYPLFFSTVITIPPGSTVRVVCCDSNSGDTSTNRYEVPKWDMENDANTKALLGGIQGTLSTDGGSTFTETDTDIVPFALILSQAAGVTVGGSEFSVPKKLPLLRYRRGHL